MPPILDHWLGEHHRIRDNIICENPIPPALPRFPISDPPAPPGVSPSSPKVRHNERNPAFDDFGRPRYDKLWRISVLRVVVSFLFRIAILWKNAHGIWCLVVGRQKLQRHWRLPPLVSAVVLLIKSTRPICTRNSCARNARNGAGALRPSPNSAVLFGMELLQSLGNGHANERQPRRNRFQPRINTDVHGLIFLGSGLKAWPLLRIRCSLIRFSMTNQGSHQRYFFTRWSIYAP
jgi:hypothetical protein